jgi:hypothetical protein
MINFLVSSEERFVHHGLNFQYTTTVLLLAKKMFVFENGCLFVHQQLSEKWLMF